MAGPALPAFTATRVVGIGRRQSRRTYGLIVAAFGVLLLAGTVIAIGAGAVGVSPAISVKVVNNHVVPGTFPVTWAPPDDQIIWSFRLPRVLPVAGLGLSSAAFGGALVAMLLVYEIAQRRGRVSAARMLLAGVALSYLFNAGYSFLLLHTDNLAAAQTVIFWLLGSIAGAEWSTLALPAAALAIGIVALLLQARPLIALLSGDETAASLGIGVRRFQIQMLVLCSLVIGVMVSVSGQIAFVGLIVPHVARLIVADHRRVLPISALLGAFFLVLADLVDRTLNAPNELPLTIVTAFVGVPFFLWLLRRRHHTAAETLG